METIFKPFKKTYNFFMSIHKVGSKKVKCANFVDGVNIYPRYDPIYDNCLMKGLSPGVLF